MEKRYNEDDLLKDLKPPFKESKEAIWDKLSTRLTDQPAVEEKGKVIDMRWPRMAAAAGILLIIGAALFARFFSSSIDCPRGEHLAYTLPDGSTITLNAESSLNYHPYWWSFDRTLNFEGEAFFEVEKGSSFTVHSALGTTQVLGTSFNISTRSEGYEVFCATGKVQVSSPQSGAQVVITPAMSASLTINQSFAVSEATTEAQYLGWKSGKFNFTEKPLEAVFEEIERQYAIDIEVASTAIYAHNYTGFFTKTQAAEVTLDVICQTFDFHFVKQADNTYLVAEE